MSLERQRLLAVLRRAADVQPQQFGFRVRLALAALALFWPHRLAAYFLDDVARTILENDDAG